MALRSSCMFRHTANALLWDSMQHCRDRMTAQLPHMACGSSLSLGFGKLLRVNMGTIPYQRDKRDHTQQTTHGLKNMSLMHTTLKRDAAPPEQQAEHRKRRCVHKYNVKLCVYTYHEICSSHTQRLVVTYSTVLSL